MFAGLGHHEPIIDCRRAARDAVTRRLGDDVVAFVVNHPHAPGRLAALAAGSVADRLPVPGNPSGRIGYVQWVTTDTGWRRRGLAREVTATLLDWFDSAQVLVTELHTSADGCRL